MSTPTYHHSQHGQDRFVDEHFRHKRNGTFVEVGAHNGLFLSNSYYLEKERGWTGLCVEANPSVFTELLHNRPSAINECCAAYDRDNVTLPFVMLSGHTEMLSGVKSSYYDDHQARIVKEVAEHGGESTEIQVPCCKLDTLLLKHGITHVDYLSIDTEGSEIQVLRGLDLERVAIELISVEVNYNDQGNEIRAFMALTQRYVPVHQIGCDWFFKRVASSTRARQVVNVVDLIDGHLSGSVNDAVSHVVLLRGKDSMVHSRVPYDQVVALVDRLLAGAHVREIRDTESRIEIDVSEGGMMVAVLKHGLPSTQVDRLKQVVVKD
jgi:FkbM family methyltransferase